MDSSSPSSDGPIGPIATVPVDMSHSRFVQRLRRRYADLLDLLAPGAPTRETMAPAYQALRERGLDVGAALRVLRQLVLERLATLDCTAQAPLEVVTRGMTELAELALDIACQTAFAELDERHGAPCGADGARAELWIIGMGKFGARELNVSSDIDLIYVYDVDGQTAGNCDGRGQISNQEYFTRVVKQIHLLIADVTEHGFVFRIDLALRPNGNSGPSVISLAGLEVYLMRHGREWERFAWLKSRVVAPQSSLANGSAQAMRGVVLPFVFRRYLDYAVFDALRDLHRQIRSQANRRSAGRPERANDVKLSRGGIREIEFIVQLLQVVRGGQFPELRTRPTLASLERVARAGLMPEDTAEALARAYTFLRQLEHRIQYLDDQQTHVLPTRDDDLEWIALSMGYADSSALLCELVGHRETVAEEFDKLLGGASGGDGAAAGECTRCRGAGQHEPPSLDRLIERVPERVSARLTQWRDSPRVLGLRDEGHMRLRKLVQRTTQWLVDGEVSEDAVLRMVDWLEPLMRRENYLALLIERPAVHLRVLKLLGAARWPVKYLVQHPGVIDELANPDMLHERFDAELFEQELESRRTSLAITGEDDEETLLNLLRRAHHGEVLRTLARDLEQTMTVEQVADDLSALADSTLAVCVRWCWDRLKKRHSDCPQLGVIAYGKLGGKELGYGSDLDLVFVYDDDDERAPEVYSAFVRKLINWLTVKTGEGDLFEVDTALRPNGGSGLLVTSFEAYADYQAQRGSNTAWTWEHQAMTRARFVRGAAPAASLIPCSPLAQAGMAGPVVALDEAQAHEHHALSVALEARFDQVRRDVITAPRDHAALRDEIAHMRERVAEAHPVKTELFDVKHSVGGMVDAEFAVQYLVLAHAAKHPGLIDNVGNIALLQRAEAAGLLPAGVGEAAANAYRALRRTQHRLRLDEALPQVAPGVHDADEAAVNALWLAVFSAPRP